MSEKDDEIFGRVLSIRKHGGIVFVDIKYGRDTFNVIFRKDILTEPQYEDIKDIKIGDYIKCHVSYHENEIIAQRLISVESVGEYFHNTVSLSKIETYSNVLSAVRNYLCEEGFIELRLPTLHKGKTKANHFSLNFFNSDARLSSSNALYITICAANLGKVYSLQKSFRAEASKTFKHLSEFDMLEVGIAGISFNEFLDFTEDFVKIILANLLKAEIIKTDHCTNFRRVHYWDIAKEYGIENKGLGKLELEIASSGPIFVTHFPAPLSSWAALSKNEKEKYSFNLLLPGVGEVAEGCLRDTRKSFMAKKIKTLKLEEQIGWYADLLPSENVPVCCFGIGVERLSMWLAGIKNIRHMSMFYRDMGFSEDKTHHWEKLR